MVPNLEPISGHYPFNELLEWRPNLWCIPEIDVKGGASTFEKAPQQQSELCVCHRCD